MERGRIADKAPGVNAEEKLWLLDHPNVHEWALENGLVTDDGRKWNEPVLRIDVEFQKEDEEFDALTKTGTIRADWLATRDDYRIARRRREAFEKKVPQEHVENYMAYHELTAKGYRQERFLFNNPDFAEALGLKIPDRVPSAKYDDLLEEKEQTPEEDWPEENDLRMDAFKKFVPDAQVENYVAFHTLPEDQGPYQDDWFLIEHLDFYKQVYLGIMENKRKDFRKVPTRAVFAKYRVYLSLRGSSKKQEQYRLKNPDLEEWGQLARNWKPLKKHKKGGGSFVTTVVRR